MNEYPKIETLFNRDEKTRKVISGQARLVEFYNVRYWHITEKIDGTNIRVCLNPDGSVSLGGRTENAQLPTRLLNYLRDTFTQEKMRLCFESSIGNEVILFGDLALRGGDVVVLVAFNRDKGKVKFDWVHADISPPLERSDTIGARTVVARPEIAGLSETSVPKSTHIVER